MVSDSTRDRAAFKSALRDTKLSKKSERFSRSVLLTYLDNRLQNVASSTDADYPRESGFRLSGGKHAVNELADQAREDRVSKAWLRTVLKNRIAQLTLAHRMLDRGNGHAQTRGRSDEFCHAYGDFRMCLDIAAHFDLGI